MTDATIMITGVTGQIGQALLRALEKQARIVALDRTALDLRDVEAIRRMVRTVQPDLIINAAAFTAVDRAEQDLDLAFELNATAPMVFAQEAAKLAIPLIHYSTDYVFSGNKPTAYVESDDTVPLNAYGHSKLAGERAVRASGAAHLILRTSWIYAREGKNFLNTVLRLGAERESVQVVADQIGAPTWAETVATMTAGVVAQGLSQPSAPAWWTAKSGVYHLSAAGETSWAGFASAIFAHRGIDCRIERVASRDYPSVVARPLNSRLSNAKLSQAFGLAAPDWRISLQRCLDG